MSTTKQKDDGAKRINITGAWLYYLAKVQDSFFSDKLAKANKEILRLKKIISALKKKNRANK